MKQSNVLSRLLISVLSIILIISISLPNSICASADRFDSAVVLADAIQIPLIFYSICNELGVDNLSEYAENIDLIEEKIQIKIINNRISTGENDLVGSRFLIIRELKKDQNGNIVRDKNSQLIDLGGRAYYCFSDRGYFIRMRNKEDLEDEFYCSYLKETNTAFTAEPIRININGEVVYLDMFLVNETNEASIHLAVNEIEGLLYRRVNKSGNDGFQEKLINSYKEALNTFADIIDAKAKHAASEQEFKEQIDGSRINIHVGQTPQGEYKIKRGLEGLPKKLHNLIVAVSKAIWGKETLKRSLNNHVAARFERINSSKPFYIVVDSKSKNLMERIIGNDIFKEQIDDLKLIRKGGKQIFRVVDSLNDVPNNAFSKTNPKVIYLCSFDALEKIDQRNDMLYLAMIYTNSSLYLAANLLLANGRLEEINDKNTVDIIKGLYDAVLDREVSTGYLNNQFRKPSISSLKGEESREVLHSMYKAILQISAQSKK